MEILFDKNKECDCYKQLVTDKDNPDAIRKFSRRFDKNLATAAIKIHQRLESAPNAAFYNSTASPDNTIQIISGSKDNVPLPLKVRIQQSYRKFFHFYVTNSHGEDFCLTKDWKSKKFEDISKLFVYDVNKHNYKNT